MSIAKKLLIEKALKCSSWGELFYLVDLYDNNPEGFLDEILPGKLEGLSLAERQLLLVFGKCV